ncbi:(2Fe-2S)-binding protein [Hydrogenimonas sp. SS33]|uniref:(2Fe-2S)-binding protein n=1 Tax=Hydrogenimonas leucolamina TaxID=2954236 RepID=UPI00336C1CCE
MTPDPDRLICYCNNLTVADIAKVIKENGIETLEELLEQDVCPMGDICEACREEGYENDGFNLPMVFASVLRKT